MRRLAQFVEHVPDRSKWVAPGHAGTGEAHDGPGLFPLCRFVAVNGTFGAGWFGSAVGAFLETLFGIVHQLFAGAAELTVHQAMVMLAIDTGHASKSILFAFQSSGQWAHVLRIAVFSIHLFDRSQLPRIRTGLLCLLP